MSFVNIRKLKEIAQKKINGLTNQSELGEFEDLVRFVQLSGGGHLSVDSDGTLPDTAMIAFDKQYDRFFYNKKAPKFRDDASRPGGTVSDNAVTRTFDRRRRRRTNWSRKIYGRIAQGFPQPAPTTDVIQGNIGYFGGNNGTSHSLTFASNSVSTAISGIATTRAQGTGGASKTHGYWMGGGNGPYTSSVQKWPFAATDGLSDVGDLIGQSNGTGAHSHNEAVGNRAFVYAAGGVASRTNVIQKMPTASDTDFTDVGDLTYNVNYNSGMSSETHGYTASGNSPPYVTTINKWPFTTDTNATLVGNLALAQFDGSGQSSTDNGYHTSGYYSPSARRKDVQKFPFASDGDGTDIGDLSYGGHYTTGTQSTTNGYQIGGNNMQPYLQYFPFASDTMYNPSVAANLAPTSGARQKDQSTQDVAS